MVFFLCFFKLSHFYDTTLQPEPHLRLLGPVLQPDSLKLESCEFNIIINIINITLGSSVAVRPKALGHIFVKRPNTLKF
jgi:hypothetical protein